MHFQFSTKLEDRKKSPQLSSGKNQTLSLPKVVKTKLFPFLSLAAVQVYIASGYRYLIIEYLLSQNKIIPSNININAVTNQPGQNISL